MKFRVLFVCTGNICRSPMAERLFLARLDRSAPVQVLSAGTSGLTGWPMDATSARVLRELDGDPNGHCAQRVTVDLVAGCDLVLTAEREHRDAIKALVPDAAGRTFTLREFVRLSAGAGPPAAGADALRARVREIAARRAVNDPGTSADDIADPYGARLSFVRSCAGQIADAVDGVLRGLGLAARHSEASA